MIAVLLAAVAIVFQPPAEPVRYRTTHIRPGPAGPLHVSIDKTLGFVRHGDGWHATLTVTDIATDAPPPIAATILAGLEPFRGVPVTVEVDRTGQVGAVLDGAAAWAKVAASYDAVAASLATRGLPATTQAALRNALHAAAAIDRNAQDARLREPIADLIGPPPDAEEVGADTATARYQVAARDGAEVRTAITLSRQSGLVLERRTERRVETASGPAQATEQTRQIP